MTLAAFMGLAGVGKTYNLLDTLKAELQCASLQEGQRVLGITFMQGSRRRLEESLRKTAGIRGRYLCMTVDRFAWELCSRWRSLLRVHGMEIGADDYERTCDTAGFLLEKPAVARWIASAYPKVVLDEAQDLTPSRLRMVRAVEGSVSTFAAADDFQCLEEALRPNPAVSWINETCQPRILTTPRRTTRSELLEAAQAVRNGATVAASLIPKGENRGVTGNFDIIVAPGRRPYKFAAAWVSGAIQWNGGAEIAILTPARSDFSTTIVEEIRTTAQGTKRKTGPFPIHWEQNERVAVAEAMAALTLPPDGGIAATLDALSAVSIDPVLHSCRMGLDRHRRLTGCASFPAKLVRQHLEAAFSQYRRFGRRAGARVRAMTIHQAKNREFEGVIVLWPYTAGGMSDEQQRRLLYNAITRAKGWCRIIVPSRDLLLVPPFAERT